MSELMFREYFSIRYCYNGKEEKIPTILDTYVRKQTDLSDINKVLELYNIMLFINCHNYDNNWNNQKYKDLSQSIEKDIRTFFLEMTEERIVPIYEKCVIMFRDDFLHLFYCFKVYERITERNFKKVINGLKMSPNKLLENKKFVDKFDELIAEMLRDPEFGARFIVDYYLGKENNNVQYYFPASLSKEDKYNIVKSYINCDIVNAHTLELITNGKTRKAIEFDVDSKLKLLAKKRYEKYLDEKAESMIMHESGINVSFSPDNPEIELSLEGNILNAKYNINWIKENLDYPTLLNNFIYLFMYTDEYMRCTLTSENHRPSIIENLFLTQGNGIYQCGQTFRTYNALSNIQMHGYVDILKNWNIYIEEIIRWFFEVYLIEEFNVDGFKCNIPLTTDSLLSRYERLVTVMDGITKQFKLYCEEGEIDRELYEMTSGSIKFKDIPSLIKNKYGYANSKDIFREIRDVFSDQTLLSDTEKTNNRYDTLYDLLCSEYVKVDEIYVYNREEIEWLKMRGTIIDKDGYLFLSNDRVWCLQELFKNGVICLQYKNSECLKSLIMKGEIKVGSTLLSKPEWEYFDYILNKAEFSNGLDLRNKYIHDTNSLDEKVQQNDYIMILKMFVLLVIKINEEFCLRDNLSGENVDFYEI